MTLATADLVNQFRRLVETAPRTYAYGSPWNDVVNGRNLDPVNCMAAVGAILASVQVGFDRHFSPNEIRSHQTDFSGGIGLDDVDTAFGRLGIERLILPNNAGPFVVRAWLREGRVVGMGVDYGKIPRPVQAQKGGTFDHALALSGLYPDDTTDLYDTLAHTIERVALSDIFPAAEALAQRVRGDGNRLFVGATKPRPLMGLVLRYGGTKTARQPDRTRAEGPNGSAVNVHRAPRTGLSTVAGKLSNGAVFEAFQTTTGDSFGGSRTWYGNRDGTRWIAAKRLSHKGGAT